MNFLTDPGVICVPTGAGLVRPFAKSSMKSNSTATAGQGNPLFIGPKPDGFVPAEAVGLTCRQMDAEW